MRNSIPEIHMAELYLEDYLFLLTCNKTCISSKKIFTNNIIQKFSNYFCSVHWYRQLHTARRIFRIVAFCLLLHLSPPPHSPTKMITNLMKSSIKSIVKCRDESGWKLLNHSISCLQAWSITPFFLFLDQDYKDFLGTEINWSDNFK